MHNTIFLVVLSNYYKSIIHIAVYRSASYLEMTLLVLARLRYLPYLHSLIVNLSSEQFQAYTELLRVAAIVVTSRDSRFS